MEFIFKVVGIKSLEQLEQNEKLVVGGTIRIEINSLGFDKSVFEINRIRKVIHDEFNEIDSLLVTDKELILSMEYGAMNSVESIACVAREWKEDCDNLRKVLDSNNIRCNWKLDLIIAPTDELQENYI